MKNTNNYSELTTLSLNISDGVAYLTFNRPTVMNTYDLVMSRELPGCMESLAEDDNIKLVVLRGANGVFMAGGDLSFLKEASEQNQEQTIAAIRSLNETIMSIMAMDKLVVAAVEGACAGAGISIMLACDFAYCAQGTKFNTAYSSLGLTPDGGMSFTLPRMVGMKKAMDLILLSEPFWAEDAYNYGIVNKVLAKDNFDYQINQLVQMLVKKPKQTVVNLKALIRHSLSNGLEQQLSEELESFVECTKTLDFKLAVDAFLNKVK